MMPSSGPGSASQSNEPLSLQLANEFDKSLLLIAQPLHQFRIFDATIWIQQVVDLRHENTFGKQISVAIAKDHLQLLDRAERTPHSGAQPDKTDWPMLETFREFKHVDEVFEHAR